MSISSDIPDSRATLCPKGHALQRAVVEVNAAPGSPDGVQARIALGEHVFSCGICSSASGFSSDALTRLRTLVQG